MILTGYARLGRDAELRYTPSGDAVANLSLAFNYGRKGDDGNRPTQWVDATLWGSRAEALIDYLKKGTGLSVVLEDPHVEMYDRQGGGQGAALRARVLSLEFAGSSGGQQQGGEHQQRQAGGQQRGAQQQRTQRNEYAEQTGRGNRVPQQRVPAGGGFDEMDDDIPF
jgi:single-strand DNA-binding protein